MIVLFWYIIVNKTTYLADVTVYSFKRLRYDITIESKGGYKMNPRERIATILFIEQIKHTEAHFCQSVKYKEIVKKKGEKTCSEKPEVIAE